MKKIDIKKFNFSYFLSERKIVESLENGAIENGGATKFDDAIYSNFEGNNQIKILKNNEISIFIPDTINGNVKTDNKKIVTEIYKELQVFYQLENMKFYNTNGSWLLEKTGKVVIDNITIISVKLENLCELDIIRFKKIAEKIKIEMVQEGVTIAINTAMAIV